MVVGNDEVEWAEASNDDDRDVDALDDADEDLVVKEVYVGR